MRKYIIGLMAGLFFLQLVASQPEKATPPEPPALLIYRQPALHGTKSSGLVVALWANGDVVFADDQDKPGTQLRQARIDAEEVSRLIEVTKCLGLSEAGGLSQRLLDAGFRAVVVQTKEHGRQLVREINQAAYEYVTNATPWTVVVGK